MQISNLLLDDDMTGTTIPASLLSHDGKAGLVRAGSEQVDATVDFTVKGGNALAPDSKATWKGTLTVAKARLLDLPAGAGHEREHLHRCKRLSAQVRSRAA